MFCLSGVIVAHDMIPGALPAEPVALVNATLHPVSAEPIQSATLVFERGKIVAMGASVEIPANATRIDMTGKHVYPGLISPNSSIGLIEIDAVRATLDLTEPGTLNPNARAESAVNPDSELIPVTRANGILTAHVSPVTKSGSLMGGSTAAMALDGWTHEDMTIQAPVGIALNWPKDPPVPVFDLNNAESLNVEKYEEIHRKNIKLLKDSFAAARAYWKATLSGNGPVDVDLRWEALKPVLEKEIPVIVRASSLRQINEAIEWAEYEDINLVLLEAQDAWRIADVLAEKEIPVIVGSINELPKRRWESYDTPFTNAVKLHQAGVLFAIGFGGRGGDSGVEKNLPYEAAKAVAFGLPPEVALMSITLNAAKILGIDDRIGSLEVGKDATIIITTGDPLDIRTQVVSAYIAGRPVDLSSRHTQLYSKYKKKYDAE